MKTIKMKTRKLFMRTLLEVAARNGSDLVEPHAPELHELRQREDYDRVIAVLGLIEAVKGPNVGSIRYRITPDGMCFFERLRDDRRRLLVRSVLIPVLVSLITSALTVYVLPSLGKQAEKWLSDTQSHIQQTTQDTAPDDARSNTPQPCQQDPQEIEETSEP